MAMTLFASVTNTGGVMCWLFLCLETHPEWKDKLQHEIDDFIKEDVHTAHDQPFHLLLSDIPSDYMAERTPTIDLVVNETLRKIMIGTFMRRNTGDDIFVDGIRIRKGAYLMFPTADLHLNEELYPNTFVFDPTRWLPEAVEARSELGVTFLGWGAGRHVCVGKRAAMLMMRLVLITLMSGFELTLVGEDGGVLKELPESLNDRLFKVCRPKTKVTLRYRQRLSQS